MSWRTSRTRPPNTSASTGNSRPAISTSITAISAVATANRAGESPLGSREGILLGPVYTGRSMGALVDLIRKKTFRPDETVLFWHTGGAPALFAYAKDLI